MPPRRAFFGRVADAVRHIFMGTGFFPPGEPLITVAPEGTPPRQFEYPITVNKFTQPRGTEQTGFFELRGLSENCGLIRYAIETCKDEEERFDHDWVPDEDSKRKDNDTLLNEIVAFMRTPDGVTPFRRWMRALREDQLAIDAPALHIRRTKRGEPYALEYIDGATIRPLTDVTGRVPRVGPAYEQIVYGVKAAEFTREELIYLPRNRRPHRLYGYPVPEQLLIVGNSVAQRTLYRLLYYSEGNIPPVFLKAPKEWTEEQIKRAQITFDQYAGDITRRRRIMVVPEMGVEQMVEPPLKTDVDEWDAREVMFAFSLSPIPFIKQGMNRATATVVQDTAIDQGLIPRQMFWTDYFRLVLQAGWGVEDVSLKWQEVRDPDPKVEADIATLHIHADIRTINEVRKERGDDPIEGGDEPIIVIGNQLTLVRDLTEQATLSPQERAEAAAIAGGRGIVGAQQDVEVSGGGTISPEAIAAGQAKRSRRRVPAVPATPTGVTPEEKAAADAGAPLKKRARRTVQTIPKAQRNFWLAAHATAPPRARPKGSWRGA